MDGALYPTASVAQSSTRTKERTQKATHARTHARTRLHALLREQAALYLNFATDQKQSAGYSSNGMALIKNGGVAGLLRLLHVGTDLARSIVGCVFLHLAQMGPSVQSLLVDQNDIKPAMRCRCIRPCMLPCAVYMPAWRHIVLDTCIDM